MDLFDSLFLVPEEDIRFVLRESIEWLDYFLNPRSLRGSDFLMRWSQGRWSEDRLIEAVNQTEKYFAIPYGPSSVAPDDIREVELYLGVLQVAGMGQLKRPDLLIYHASDTREVEGILREIDGSYDLPFDLPPTTGHHKVQKLPFVRESDARMERLLSKAVLAVECENSLWIGKRMPDYGKPMKPMKRLDGREGMRKDAKLPTIIIKEEDRPGLRTWQEQNGVQIHIWHAFYDVAFGISLDEAERVISDGLIEPKKQVFQSPGGATTSKRTYNIYYHYAYTVGEARESPTLVADKIIDKNGHILPYVRFEGGSMILGSEALVVMGNAYRERRGSRK